MKAPETRLRQKAEEDADIDWAVKEIDRLRSAVREVGRLVAESDRILVKVIR